MVGKVPSQEDYEALLQGSEPTWTKKGAKNNNRKIRWILLTIAVVCCTALAFSARRADALIRLINVEKLGWVGKPVEAQVMPYTLEGEAPMTMTVNQTLGFEKIIALNMPDRMDRKDEIALLASASDLQIDFLSTQDAKTFNKNGLPFLVKDLSPSEIGCYRAHLDAWQHILTNNIQSALVIEDDADWDVDIK